MDENKPLDIETLKLFEPLSTLSNERLTELSGLTFVEKLNLGVSLFSEGDIDGQTVYLMDGDVQVKSSDGSIDMIVSAGSEQARFPLDDSQPRQVSCIAMSVVRLLRVDNGVLDYMMTWDQLAASETAVELEKQQNQQVTEEQTKQHEKLQIFKETAEADKSWIRKMRHIMAFKSMPPANIKPLLEKMESVDVKKGDVIVKQGEPGDYYYVLTEGQARVTRTIELARLDAGTSFGEEALIAESKRNASVTMASDGNVMRLSKADFDALLKEPLVERIGPDDARVQTLNKKAVWLDVRHAKEYHFSKLPKAINIPLHELRLRLEELEKDIHYICYCGTGKRSSAAAFLLRQNGYNASVLNGGVQTMAKDLVK
jgi:rhodanese-related sulfurtransferase/signal-transduction protein with cAMP-binding, CBS, and nucleotidyltransferase domain